MMSSTFRDMDRPLIGILALQGAFREHSAAFGQLGARVREVRLPEDLEALDGLVIPGGESTVITKLIASFGLSDHLRSFRRPIFGTCAGLIVLDRDHLERIDIATERNAYGPQVRSFETDLDLGDGTPFRAVFIRAPRVVHAGPGVDILATVDGQPVLARQGGVLVASFHPELTDDLRIHKRFLELVGEDSIVRA